MVGLPLNGLRVIDLGMFIAGPCAGHVLAGLGAEVLKIEPPAGDPFRSFGEDVYSPQFQAYNAGKKSIVLDYLHSVHDRELLARLIKKSDILIENFRPGVLAKVSLDAGNSLALNPKLVYCSISGFGQTGPLADRPCFDTIGQAASGFLSQMTDTDNPHITGPAIADSVSGHYAAQGILAALIKRSSTGRGCHIDISMMDAMMHFSIEPFAAYFAAGSAPNARSRVGLSQSFLVACKDKRLIAIHLSSKQKFWDRLVNLLGESSLRDDHRFATRELRIRNFELLELELNSHFANHDSKIWLNHMEGADIPAHLVLTLEEVENSSQTVSRRSIRKLLHPLEQGVIKTISAPWRMDDEICPDPLPPPLLDQHRQEILRMID